MLWIMEKGHIMTQITDFGVSHGVAKTPTDRDLKHSGITTSYWDKHMWSAEKNDVIKEVQDYVRKRGNR
jgi:hypothetical protein